MGKSVLLFFVILAACASIGSTLHCFECIPMNFQNSMEACQDPFKANTVQTKVCRPEEVCFKQIAPATSIAGQDVPTITIRGCAPKSLCSNEPTQLQEYCHICSTELCNSVVQVIPSLSTFIVLYIIKLLFL